jgi:hypothetical protein
MRWLAIVSVVFLYGCYVPRKAERHLAKIQNKYPELLASKAMQLYPIVERIDSFEVVKWRDSILEVTNIDTTEILDTLWIDCEFIKKKEKKYQQTIENLRTAISNPTTIIKYINDSTKLYLMRKELTSAKAEADKYRKNYDVMIKLALAFLAALVLSLVVHIIRYYLKK